MKHYFLQTGFKRSIYSVLSIFLFTVVMISCNSKEEENDDQHKKEEKTKATASSLSGNKKSAHQDAFNLQVDDLMAAYFQVKDAFIEADTAIAKSNTQKFKQLLNAIDTAELKKDTLPVYQNNLSYMQTIMGNADDLIQQNNVTDMRYSFRDLSDNLRAFLIGIRYEGVRLYVQRCPMAFNDTEEATWISNTEKIMNPYLGKKHPKYQSGMLECGEVVETIEPK